MRLGGEVFRGFYDIEGQAGTLYDMNRPIVIALTVCLSLSAGVSFGQVQDDDDDFEGGALHLPSLEDRDLGEPALDEDGERVIWKQRLPFLAQQVIDLGFELPNPYGIALIPAAIQQDLILDNLVIGINGPPDTEIDFVDFGTPSVDNTTVQLRADAWIWPFLNASLSVGTFDGKAVVPLAIQGADLFPGVCGVAPQAPICTTVFEATAFPEYHGENITLGVNAAVGWKQFFFTLPITYAWTSVNIIDTNVEALNVSPRMGMTFDAGDEGTLAFFVGAMYLRAEVDLAGSITFDTPGGPSGETTTITYEIRQRNKDRWNYLLGFNWEINRRWNINAEGGFGGSRDSLIAGVTYRF